MIHSVGDMDAKMSKHGVSKERGSSDVDSKWEPPYDRYKFLEKLGEGTYGVVYKGIFKETGEVSILLFPHYWDESRNAIIGSCHFGERKFVCQIFGCDSEMWFHTYWQLPVIDVSSAIQS